MKQSRKRRLILAAVVGAVPVMCAAAFAQVQVQQQGRAQDANTRVGSNGYNDTVGQGTASYVSPSNIAYGNVTGLRGFRGPIAERDPRAFTGPIGGRLGDVFIRDSSAAPLPYQPSADQLQPQAFYGDTRGVAPPVGTVRQGFTGSYLGTQYTPQNPLAQSSEFTSALGDVLTQPLGKSEILGLRSNALGLQQGELVLQGPLEANNQATLFAGSPLYGVRQYRMGQQLGETGVFSLYGQPGALGEGGRVDESTIRQMRQELFNSAIQQPQSPVAPDQNQTPQTGQPNNLGQPQQPSNLNQSLESPDNSANNTSFNPSNAPGAFTSTTNTNQGLQRRSTIPTPGQQMAQYDELQKRMQRYENPQAAAIEQAHQFRMEQIRQARATGAHPASQPAGFASSAISPRASQQAALPAAQRPAKPLKIKSLAEGVRFAGLRDLLTRAEEQMKQGKFQSAVETYDAAQKVAPNNWMIRLGRANAELGGGFYAQASEDIHEAYAYSPPLVMGQYDLNSMMSPERVKFITRELNDLASKNSNDETPAFLLAYVAYNTGDEAQAANYLKQAEERAGGKDVLLKLLRQRWSLADTGSQSTKQPAPAELNK